MRLVRKPITGLVAVGVAASSLVELVACEVYSPDLLQGSSVAAQEQGDGPSSRGQDNDDPSGPASPSNAASPSPSDPASPNDPDDPSAPAAPGAPSTPVAPPPRPPVAGTTPVSSADPATAPAPGETATPGDPTPAESAPASTNPDAAVPPLDPEDPGAPVDPAAPAEPEPADDAPSDTPLIANFEGDPSRLRGGSREGFWFTGVNGAGAITDVEDVFIDTPDGEGAAHVVASGFDVDNDERWAGFGVNFNAGEPPPVYSQAAQYDGLHFWACTPTPPDAAMSELYVEMVTTDSSPEYDGEGNNYRYVVELTQMWQEFTIPWDELSQTWGAVTDFNVNAVLGLQFSLKEGGFDLWLDSLEFIDPAGSSTTGPSGPCPFAAVAEPEPEPTPVDDAGAL